MQTPTHPPDLRNNDRRILRNLGRKFRVRQAPLASKGPYLGWDEKTIHEVAEERLAGEPLATVLLRQAWTEARVVLLKKVRYRSNENEAAVAAYQRMRSGEFEDLNARQQWANWRTIPRNLNGRIPNRPLRAIDLCCGVGHSTAVLACYLPEGSSLLGLESTPAFVETARARVFTNRSSRLADVRFNAQSVLETFRDDSGAEVPSGTIDVVNSSGAVGHHFTPATTRELAREIDRVLKPGGLACIDSGASGTNEDELVAIFRGLGYDPVNRARSCFVDPLVQLAFRKAH